MLSISKKHITVVSGYHNPAKLVPQHQLYQGTNIMYNNPPDRNRIKRI